MLFICVFSLTNLVSSFYVNQPRQGQPTENRYAPDDTIRSAFERIDAISYSKLLGTGRERNYDNPNGEPLGMNIAAVIPGGYLVYENIDFDSGAKGFKARVGAWHTGGAIELRVGSLRGQVIGRLPVTNTGSWQHWETQSTTVNNVSGVHDLYLIFLDSPGGIPVASLNWFVFTKESVVPPKITTNTPDLEIIYKALEKAKKDYDPEIHQNYIAFINPDYQAINRGEWEEIGLTEIEALERYFYELALTGRDAPNRDAEELLGIFKNSNLIRHLSSEVRNMLVPEKIHQQFSVSSKTLEWDTFSDTWVASDDLDRALPIYEEVGDLREDRYVGMFYFIRNSSRSGNYIFDISVMEQEYSNLGKVLESIDYLRHYWWGEPYLGYYTITDEFVIRKHAQMLADAGVDVIFIDVTNGLMYHPEWLKIFKIYQKIREEGGQTPQIAFFGPGPHRAAVGRSVIDYLYEHLYSKNLFSDLWFMWEGKPLYLGAMSQVQNKEILDFFTNRTTWAWSDRDWFGDGMDAWTWVDDYPQQYGWSGATKPSLEPIYTALEKAKADYDPEKHANYIAYIVPEYQAINRGEWEDIGLTEEEALERYFYELALTGRDAPNRKPNELLEIFKNSNLYNHLSEDALALLIPPPEQVSVSVAQHPTHEHGRSFHDGSSPQEHTPELGLSYTEQWERALEIDPKFVFITGWNEWWARGMITGNETGRRYLGHNLPAGSAFLVDKFNAEFSRDIEPMQGGFRDNYYYQTVNYIRQYKGGRPLPKIASQNNITINNDFSQWYNIEPEFRDDIGDVTHRNHVGWQGSRQYINETGRNDFVLMKTAYDEENIYFYVATHERISTPNPKEKNWMTLLINVNADYDTGWYGYDYIINRQLKDENTGIVEKNKTSGAWEWEEIGEINFVLRDNEMHFAVSRDLIELESDNNLIFDFKWIDNVPDEDNIMHFYDHGDVAPNGRFNYRFMLGDNTEQDLNTEQKVTSKLSNAIALFLNKNTAYIKNVVTQVDNNLGVKPLTKDGETLIPLKFVAESLAAEFKWISPSSVKIITRNGNIINLNVGNRIIKIDEEEITLETSPQIINDSIFISLSDVSKLFEINVFEDDSGLIILSRQKDLFNPNEDQKQINYLVDLFQGEGHLVLEKDPEELKSFYPAYINTEAPVVKPGYKSDKLLKPIPESYPLPIPTEEDIPLEIISVAASSSQFAHPARNVIDGDSTTKWTAEGNQWIKLDLGQIKEISGLGIQFLDGSSRQYTFDIQVSEDGETWITLKEKSLSSGKVTDLEKFEFDPTLARYVRIFGAGSSRNSKNAYHQIEIYATK